MKVEELMRKPVVTVQVNETCERAAQLMAENHTGAVAVLAENGRLAGIITDRDLVTQCMAKGHDPSGVKVQELCASNPVTITPNSDVEYAINRMQIAGVRRLPVVEHENQLVGMLSLDDVAAHYYANDAIVRVASSYAHD